MTAGNGGNAGSRILIVDDDADLLRLLAIRLRAAGYDVTPAESAERALALMAAERPRLVITDLRMDGMDGIGLFEAIRRTDPTLPVIILTAHGTIPEAVEATRRGVFGYLTKPFDAQALLDEVHNALQHGGPPTIGQPGESDEWRSEFNTRSPAMEAVLERARLVAQTDASVLLVGESGTGKEVLARAIHRASPRRDGPFVAVNCGAIPEHLLESELFGHTKGAFTGAIRDHKGLFQSAHGGTIFLDEIGDMPLHLQVKLLRVLQERQARPVGANQPVSVDVRVISATHRQLEAEIAEGRFREDLFYRLKVVALQLPPLAERREDVPLLANHFLAETAQRYGKVVNGLSAEAMSLLVNAAWPGNIRQLYNVVEQAVALAQAPIISASLVEHAIHAQAQAMVPFEEARREFEREYLARLLKITDGNVSEAARIAKRNRTEFYKLLQRHRLDPGLFKLGKS